MREYCNERHTLNTFGKCPCDNNPKEEKFFSVTVKLQEGNTQPTEEQIQDALEGLGLVVTNFEESATN